MKYLIILVLLTGCGEITPTNITYRNFNSFPDCTHNDLKKKYESFNHEDGILYFIKEDGYLCKVLHTP